MALYTCLQGKAGKLVIAGAAGDPVSGGLLIWQDTSKEVWQHVCTQPFPHPMPGCVPCLCLSV